LGGNQEWKQQKRHQPNYRRVFFHAAASSFNLSQARRVRPNFEPPFSKLTVAAICPFALSPDVPF
jgi:hypothetical protein